MEAELNGKGNETITLSPKSAEDDDVCEELINSESRTPLKTPSKETEVKFIVNDSLNGDAKINVDAVKTAFAGMSKDELLKYVNDPFWVRVRMILFILFWLIWVVMFAAAIAIIVIAPRCKAPAPRKWYQEGPLYELKTESFTPNGKLSEVTEKLDFLSTLQIKGVVISSPLTADDSGNIENFKTVDSKFGSLEDFKNLLAAAKSKAINVLLNLVPNHSSIGHSWFNKSLSREAPYDSYYVWASKSGVSSDGAPLPPNNWKSKTGGPAWTWNEERQEFYLHQFDSNQPDLNFNNPKVVEEFSGILSFWLDQGVSGFNLDRVQYLLEDPERQDEAVGIDAGTTHDQYDFYMHKKTYNRPELTVLLQQWRQLVHNKTDGEGLLVINGEPPIPSDSNSTTQIVDLARYTTLVQGLPSTDFTVPLADRLESIIRNSGVWTAVQTSGSVNDPRVADIFGKKVVDPLNMLTLLLPATPITTFGDELGLLSSEVEKFPWSPVAGVEDIQSQQSDERSHMSVYKALADIRGSQAILYGASQIRVLNDNTTLVVLRWRAGHPGFVFVFNNSPNNVTANLSDFSTLPSELTAIALASEEKLLEPASRVGRGEVNLSPFSAATFTFVPAPAP